MTDPVLLNDTEICVKCGLCLPHCPTYNKTLNENESPRGRISLIQAWAGGNLEATPKLLEHIDNCLLCRSCEYVCPAEVPYGRLIDEFRSRFSHKISGRFQSTFLKQLVKNRRITRSIQSVIQFYQHSGLQQFARKSGLVKLTGLHQFERLLPEQVNYPAPANNFYPTQSKIKGNVALFKGCMGELIDFQAVIAAIRILNLCGFNVYVPNNQTCCGALELHSGNPDQFIRLAKKNIAAYSDRSLDAILTLASGCGSVLKEYSIVEPKNFFSGKVRDINQFLSETGALNDLAFQPLSTDIVLHTPCSLKNVMRSEQGAFNILRFIPQCKIIPIPDSIKCCGSAGSYMLDHPEMAQALLEDLLNFAEEQTANFLVTSNIGCALHIQAGLEETGIAMEVLHPIVLLERQLIRNQ